MVGPSSHRSDDHARVLFVDDEPLLLTAFARALRPHQISVTTAGSGRQALQILTQNPDGFDVVACDLSMPDVDGLQVLSEVAVVSPLTSRVLISGAVDAEALCQAVNRALAFQVILKPWSVHELVAALRRAAQRSALLAQKSQENASFQAREHFAQAQVQEAERQKRGMAGALVEMAVQCMARWPQADPSAEVRLVQMLLSQPEISSLPFAERTALQRAARLLAVCPEPKDQVLGLLKDQSQLSFEQTLIEIALRKLPGEGMACELGRLLQASLLMDELVQAPGYDAKLDWPLVQEVARRKAGFSSMPESVDLDLVS